MSTSSGKRKALYLSKVVAVQCMMITMWLMRSFGRHVGALADDTHTHTHTHTHHIVVHQHVRRHAQTERDTQRQREMSRCHVSVVMRGCHAVKGMGNGKTKKEGKADKETKREREST